MFVSIDCDAAAAAAAPTAACSDDNDDGNNDEDNDDDDDDGSEVSTECFMLFLAYIVEGKDDKCRYCC
tara:strand:+ start:574 stop:777 length:204 start_codon:yes stop_codon:yes gene_type:complete